MLYRCKRNVGGKVVVARHWSSTFHLHSYGFFWAGEPIEIS